MRNILSLLDQTKRWLGFPVHVRPLVSISKDIAKGKVRHIASKAGGLGDELMALGVTQAAKRLYPAWHCVFHSRYYALLKEAPNVNEVVPFDASFEHDRTEFVYEHKSLYSLNHQMAIQLGIVPTDYCIDLPRIQESNCIKPRMADGLNLVIQTDSSGWTANKDWPPNYWRSFVETLPLDWSILEVGRKSLFLDPPSHPGFHSYSGKTSLHEYTGLIQNADIFVGPPSAGMHIAHAYRIPSVIIVGGYEAAHYPYPLSHQIGTNIACAPCWLRSPCPYDHACLRSISVEQVKSAVLMQLSLASQRQNRNHP